MKNNNSNSEIINEANSLRWEFGENLHDSLMESIYQDAAQIAGDVVSISGEKPKFNWDRT